MIHDLLHGFDVLSKLTCLWSSLSNQVINHFSKREYLDGMEKILIPYEALFLHITFKTWFSQSVSFYVNSTCTLYKIQMWGILIVWTIAIKCWSALAGGHKYLQSCIISSWLWLTFESTFKLFVFQTKTCRYRRH